MGLSTKKPTKAGQALSSKVTETAARISYLSDNEMKQLKMKAIILDIDIKKLINNSLKEIMNSNKIKFKAIDVNAKKRSFAIDQKRLKEMKVFLLNQDNITQDKLIYNAILKIIE